MLLYKDTWKRTFNFPFARTPYWWCPTCGAMVKPVQQDPGGVFLDTREALDFARSLHELLHKEG